MPWNEGLTKLNEEFAYLYTDQRSIKMTIEKAGISTARVDLNGSPINVWYEVLTQADKLDSVGGLVKVGLSDYPNNEILKNANQGKTIKNPAPKLDTDIAWDGEIDSQSYEKITGDRPTFLHVNFLELGMKRAKSVGRVKLPGGYGTGFLTENNLLLTNNHVIPTREAAQSASVQFNYQKSVGGLDTPYVELAFDPDKGFATSKEDDWTAVRMQNDANKDFGKIGLNEAKIDIGDRVNIIQHPGGGPKQIALHHNIVAYSGERRIQYLTDTLPGTSGSPVMNNQWDLVALHHSGGDIPEPGTKNLVFRNEGININRVLEGVTNAGLL